MTNKRKMSDMIDESHGCITENATKDEGDIKSKLSQAIKEKINDKQTYEELKYFVSKYGHVVDECNTTFDFEPTFDILDYEKDPLLEHMIKTYGYVTDSDYDSDSDCEFKSGPPA